jgi:NADPH:quinone reductase-like Zn-dependent oxidoreductase
MPACPRSRGGSLHQLRDKDWAAEVQDLTDGKGVDVVMDAVGADTFEGSLNSLKPLGMLISFGNASGPVPPFNIATLAQKGSLKITRPDALHPYRGPRDLPADGAGAVREGDEPAR